MLAGSPTASFSFWKRVAQRNLQELTHAERKIFETQLNKHRDSPIHLSKVQLPRVNAKNMKRGSLKDQLLGLPLSDPVPFYFLVGHNRIYGMVEGKKKMLVNEHILTIIHLENVSSFKAFQLCVKTTNMEFLIDCQNEEEVESIMEKIYIVFVRSFPALGVSLPFFDKKKFQISSAVEMLDNFLCGGFVFSYESVCDFMSIDFREDIAWDIDNLFTHNDITQFSLAEITLRTGKLSNSDFRALLRSLTYNLYFNELIVEGKQFTDVLDFVVDIFKHNGAIEKLVMKDVGATVHTMIQFEHSLNANALLALTSIDISNNPIEDKGVVVLANSLINLRNGLNSLNISNCKATSSGISELCKILTKSKRLYHSLCSLSIAGNELGTLGSQSLGKLLLRAESLTELDISNCSPEMGFLAGGKSLISFSLSGLLIADTTMKELKSFLEKSPNIKTLNISKTSINPKYLRIVLSTTPSLETLDLSDNSYGEVELSGLNAVLRKYNSVKHLYLNRCFSRTNSPGRSFQEFSYLLKSADCRIETLQLAGGSKCRIKTELIPFIVGLMTNRTLKHLDISHQHCGNHLAIALGKVLQTNRSLETLLWDGNRTHISGFIHFKNGLQRNNTLHHMVQPTLDISLCMKAETQIKLLEIVNGIQQKIFANGLLRETRKNSKIFEFPNPNRNRNSGKMGFAIDTLNARELFGKWSSKDISQEDVEQLKYFRESLNLRGSRSSPQLERHNDEEVEEVQLNSVDDFDLEKLVERGVLASSKRILLRMAIDTEVEPKKTARRRSNTISLGNPPNSPVGMEKNFEPAEFKKSASEIVTRSKSHSVSKQKNETQKSPFEVDNSIPMPFSPQRSHSEISTRSRANTMTSQDRAVTVTLADFSQLIKNRKEDPPPGESSTITEEKQKTAWKPFSFGTKSKTKEPKMTNKTMGE